LLPSSEGKTWSLEAFPSTCPNDALHLWLAWLARQLG